MKALFIGMCLCLWAGPIAAQNSWWTRAEFLPGGGWWVHSLGLSPDTDQHQGYDRSHLSFAGQTRLLLGRQLGPWAISIGPQISYLDDNELVGSADRRGRRNRVPISEGRGLRLAGAALGIQRRFYPPTKNHFVEIGLTITGQHAQHIHPDRDRMGLLWGQEWSILVGKGKFSSWALGPFVYDARFRLREALPREAHTFLILGVKIAATLSPKKP